LAARLTEPILRGQSEPICMRISEVLFCCKGSVGFVVNATAIVPKTNEALRVLVAVNLYVRNPLLNIDSGLGGASIELISLLGKYALRLRND
jgi:hypothetical protein